VTASTHVLFLSSLTFSGLRLWLHDPLGFLGKELQVESHDMFHFRLPSTADPAARELVNDVLKAWRADHYDMMADVRIRDGNESLGHLELIFQVRMRPGSLSLHPL
jgi:hypothetical protein